MEPSLPPFRTRSSVKAVSHAGYVLPCSGVVGASRTLRACTLSPRALGLRLACDDTLPCASAILPALLVVDTSIDVLAMQEAMPSARVPSISHAWSSRGWRRACEYEPDEVGSCSANRWYLGAG
jgi:hypothetical protein